jgi:hypothetical protein
VSTHYGRLGSSTGEPEAVEGLRADRLGGILWRCWVRGESTARSEKVRSTPPHLQQDLLAHIESTDAERDALLPPGPPPPGQMWSLLTPAGRPSYPARAVGGRWMQAISTVSPPRARCSPRTATARRVARSAGHRACLRGRRPQPHPAGRIHERAVWIRTRHCSSQRTAPKALSVRLARDRLTCDREYRNAIIGFWRRP